MLCNRPLKKNIFSLRIKSLCWGFGASCRSFGEKKSPSRTCEPVRTPYCGPAFKAVSGGWCTVMGHFFFSWCMNRLDQGEDMERGIKRNHNKARGVPMNPLHQTPTSRAGRGEINTDSCYTRAASGIFKREDGTRKDKVEAQKEASKVRQPWSTFWRQTLLPVAVVRLPDSSLRCALLTFLLPAAVTFFFFLFFWIGSSCTFSDSSAICRDDESTSNLAVLYHFHRINTFWKRPKNYHNSSEKG